MAGIVPRLPIVDADRCADEFIRGPQALLDPGEMLEATAKIRLYSAIDVFEPIRPLSRKRW